ncbi:MAG: tetratricopeptide repeat protein, partial [Chloroflexota bacterium]
LPTQRIPNSDRLVAHATMHKTRFIVRLGQYKDGAELGKQAVRLAKTVGDDWCAAMGHVWWCQAYWEQGLTQEALDVLEEGEAHRGKASDEYLNGRFNHQYSVIYSIRGETAKAMAKSEQAVQTFELLQATYHLLMSLNSFGAILNQSQQFNRSKSVYEQIIKMTKSSFMQNFLALAFVNLSLSLQNLQEFDQSKNFLHKSLSIFRDLGLRSREAPVYANLADLLFERGELSQAETIANKALTIANEFGITNFETDSIITLGQINLKQKHFKAALAHFLHAAEISDQNQFQEKKAEILFGISQCFIGLEDKLQAVTYAKNALEHAQASQHTNLALQIEESLQSLN